MAKPLNLPMEISEREIYRIVDANLNRAREGLRVVEELARFVFADRALQNKTKLLRHRLASLFASSAGGQATRVSVASWTERLNRESLIDLGRDAVTDVGKDFVTRTEARRTALTDLVQSNFARIEESVRALEEFTKFFSRGLSPRLKALRFDVYTLEKEYVSAANRGANALLLKGIGLYPIVDREALGDLDPIKVAPQILVPGVRIIQYRDKVSAGAEICRVCAELRRITSRKGVIFIVNDRIDIAQATAADGVHLGQDDIPVSLARRLLGSRKIIGKSTHSLAQARLAAREDIDYLSVGPIFSTLTKPGARPVGVELIARVRAMTDKPIIAIGGITEKNARDVFDKGADGGAVISAILKAENIRAAVVSLTGACRARRKSRR